MQHGAEDVGKSSSEILTWNILNDLPIMRAHGRRHDADKVGWVGKQGSTQSLAVGLRVTYSSAFFRQQVRQGRLVIEVAMAEKEVLFLLVARGWLA